MQRDGRVAAAIVHDAQLAEEPELLQAAGAIVLLVQENVELDAAWKTSLAELRDSRSRIVAASERERRKLERDLHDGAQKRLVSLRIGLAMASEHAVGDPVARSRVTGRRIGRYPPEIESAVSYCCLEALQNATKHAGPDARIAAKLSAGVS